MQYPISTSEIFTLFLYFSSINVLQLNLFIHPDFGCPSAVTVESRVPVAFMKELLCTLNCWLCFFPKSAGHRRLPTPIVKQLSPCKNYHTFLSAQKKRSSLKHYPALACRRAWSCVRRARAYVLSMRILASINILNISENEDAKPTLVAHVSGNIVAVVSVSFEYCRAGARSDLCQTLIELQSSSDALQVNFEE